MQKNPKQVQSEEKNMLFALVLIILVLMGFRVFQTPTKTQNLDVQQKQENDVAVVPPVLPVKINSDDLQKHIPTISIKNGDLDGDILSNGIGVHRLVLTQYKQTLEPNSPFVELLSDNYGFDLDWRVLGQPISLTLQSGEELTSTQTLEFLAQSRDIQMHRSISLDDHYMFTFVDTITNTGKLNLSLDLRGRIYRSKDDIQTERSVVHTGFVSLIDATLHEDNYAKVEKEQLSYQTKGAWLGITDKYWQTILIPDANEQVSVSNAFDNGVYTTQFLTNTQTLLPGQTITRTTRVFAGAKNLDLINDYMQQYHIPKFDLTIDFGWFYFLTKPFLYFLQWLYALVGNMGVAILLFATLLRLALLPIATKSYVSMAQMKKIQPQLKELQLRYKDNRVRLQQEMMALYKREKVNPAGGCLPMLIQIPVFFALYKVLSVSIQMRQAPFFGWVQDLSIPDTSSVFTLFGLINWPIPSFLNLGIWPILMGLTMYIQQRMTPQPTADKTQMNMFKWMPVIFTFMMGQFAVGLIIYWTWSNILSIAQQKYIMKKVNK